MKTQETQEAAAAQERAGWSVWAPVLVMMGCSFISYVDRQVLAVLSPSILADTGLSVQDYGTIVGFFSVLYMIGNPVWGYTLDRMGLRRGMTVAVSLWTAASAAHAFLSGFRGFALARALLGFGEGATFPGGLRTATDSLPADKRSRGIALAYSGGSLGALMTPLILTPIAVAYGWRAAFLFTGLLGAAWICGWRWVSHPKRLPQPPRRNGPISLPKVTEGRFWALVCGYALGAFPLSYVLYVAPLYLSKVVGLSQSDLGKVLWIPPLAWEIGYFFWGWAADRFAADEVRPVRLFLILGGASIPFAITGTQTAPWIVLALLFLAMFAASGFVVLSLRTGAMSYPRDHTAPVAGIGAGSWSAAVALLLPLLGRMFDQGLYRESFFVVSGIPVAGVAGWVLFSRSCKRVSL
ncbi:MAG: MFS transporter [Bryobacteraceae bacterium]|nr:MFS transporter [Bryobacteraceae bacterium]